MKRVAIFMTASLRSSPLGTYTPALVDLVQRLSAEFALTVFTVIPPTGETDQYRCGNAEVHVVPVRHNDSILQRALRTGRTFLTAHRQQPFDLVHGFWATPGGMAAVVCGELARLPSIVTLQGGEAASLPSIGYGNMSRLSTRALTLWVCRHATGLTGLTRFQVTALKSHGLKRDVRVIPYGALPGFFCGGLQRTLHPPIKLLHVADLNRVKDQETLLRAFQIISREIDCQLTVAGRDLMNGRIEQLATELGIRNRVRFLGHVHHEQLPSLYLSADILLHTSLYEAQGVVISEACAAGCVVCGTRVGLVADLEGRSAIAVPPGDAESLASSALWLLEDPARYRQLQARAKSWAVEHDAAWTAREFVKLYHEQLNF